MQIVKINGGLSLAEAQVHGLKTHDVELFSDQFISYYHDKSSQDLPVCVEEIGIKNISRNA